MERTFAASLQKDGPALFAESSPVAIQGSVADLRDRVQRVNAGGMRSASGIPRPRSRAHVSESRLPSGSLPRCGYDPAAEKPVEPACCAGRVDRARYQRPPLKGRRGPTRFVRAVSFPNSAARSPTLRCRPVKGSPRRAAASIARTSAAQAGRPDAPQERPAGCQTGMRLASARSPGTPQADSPAAPPTWPAGLGRGGEGTARPAGATAPSGFAAPRLNFPGRVAHRNPHPAALAQRTRP
jgi:hypothetical protein